jgi:hypothetical protein
MNKTWKAFLGIILIFVFGWLAGALCTSLMVGHRALALLQRGPDGVEEVLERRMTHNLGLDATQKQQVHEFLMENLKQRKELQKTIQPQIQALNRQTRQQVMTVLNPDQKQRFQENIDRLRKRLGANFCEQPVEKTPSPQVQSGGPVTNSGAGSPP